MLRIDAQHSFLPPQQDAEWLGKILARNRFEGSVYLPHEENLEQALVTAASHPYIRRVVPTVTTEELRAWRGHPLITSVRLTEPSPEALQRLAELGLALELPGHEWPLETTVPVALDGFPADVPQQTLPPYVYIKLTGFRLPATQEAKERLHRWLRNAGPERLMFASGWPQGGPWKEVLAAFTQALGPMPIAVRERLLGGTACEFYRITA